ncbi:hypothetical protein ABZT04_41775 [Streptomyces sp. NPDC005492]|uniref:hypothetical protein n=1 Tax=Streptomyces sp. NPDC005492 TaxID=3156883 RepID=UPI00339E2131
MNRLPEPERSDTWLPYDEQKHHVHLSHALTTLVDTRRARGPDLARTRSAAYGSAWSSAVADSVTERVLARPM